MIITAQTDFNCCTFRVTTARFVHHCTLKQALVIWVNGFSRSTHTAGTVSGVAQTRN